MADSAAVAEFLLLWAITSTRWHRQARRHL